jgi:hypothetical protein
MRPVLIAKYLLSKKESEKQPQQKPQPVSPKRQLILKRKQPIEIPKDKDPHTFA